MIEELKIINLNDLSIDEIIKHRNNVLKLNENEIIDYLKFSIDKFYKTEEEGDNEENIETFFDSDDLVKYFNMLEKENEEL